MDIKSGGSSGPAVVYVLYRRLIAIFALYFHALHNWLVPCYCRSQLAHASRCPVMHERFGISDSDSKYYSRSHCGMSDVAFRTAPPIGGLSCCYYYYCYQFLSNSCTVGGLSWQQIFFSRPDGAVPLAKAPLLWFSRHEFIIFGPGPKMW